MRRLSVRGRQQLPQLLRVLLFYACQAVSWLAGLRRFLRTGPAEAAQRHESVEIGPPTPSELRLACEVLEKQPSLRLRLEQLMSDFPISGLYDDEEAAPHTFSTFVRRMQMALLDSPRNVLLRRLDSEFRALYERHDSGVEELLDCLGFSQPAPIAKVAQALERLSAGKRYKQWAAAVACSKKPQQVLTDEMRQRILLGRRGKASAKGLPPPTAEEEQDFIALAARAEAARRAQANARAEALWSQVQADAEYTRYVRVHDLWSSSGAASLWATYAELDASEGAERRSRGGHFEKEHARLCFAMVVTRLREQRPSAIFECARGMKWVDRRGKQIGEIDLVVLCKACSRQSEAKVVALVEMKAGCFEIAAAFAQHEEKLAKALRDEDDRPFIRGFDVEGRRHRRFELLAADEGPVQM